ncbi:hypothetical protein ACFSC4_01150 [Deinococcus malanensis]|uniref:hypothetical protein n=1 Tax=Deinococcus malanensis TaxID=1706855 RepID=UPI00362A46C2
MTQGFTEARHSEGAGSRQGTPYPTGGSPRAGDVAGGRVVEVYTASRTPASHPSDTTIRQPGANLPGQGGLTPDAAVQGQPEATVQGRRVKRDVRGPGGRLLAVQGQIVTPTLLSRARDMGATPELVAATKDTTGQTAAGAAAVTEGQDTCWTAPGSGSTTAVKRPRLPFRSVRRPCTNSVCVRLWVARSTA